MNVGSELSGTVRNVLVDVNDTVKKGQVLVEAGYRQAQCTAQPLQSVGCFRASTLAAIPSDAERSAFQFGTAGRGAPHFGWKVPSAAEMDTGRAVVDRAIADEAASRAAVDDARAALKNDETNLSKASIKSPIDGVILTRSVDPGNAVAASLQAVTLFTVAEDLKQLRLESLGG